MSKKSDVWSINMYYSCKYCPHCKYYKDEGKFVAAVICYYKGLIFAGLYDNCDYDYRIQRPVTL